MFCTHCGERLEANANFCGACGTRTSNASAPPPPPAPPRPSFEQVFGLPEGTIQAIKRASDGPIDTDYVRSVAAMVERLPDNARHQLDPYSFALGAMQHWAGRRWDAPKRQANRKNIDADWLSWLSQGQEFLWDCPAVPPSAREDFAEHNPALAQWVEDDFVHNSLLFGQLKLNEDQLFVARQHLGDRLQKIVDRVIAVKEGADRARRGR